MKTLWRKLMKAQSKLMLDWNVAVLQQCEKQNQSITASNRPHELSDYSGVVRIWFTIYIPCVTKSIASSLRHLTFIEYDTKFFFFWRCLST